METRANYILIGAFTILGILGALGFFLWLAKVEVDRQYAYYDVLFEDVSGLGNAGDVRYNGLQVGQVVGLELDETDPSKVRVRIEVNAETPVKTDTVATLALQGVTGVSFVALSGGSAEAAALPEGGEIPTERSAIQSIFEGAPELLERAIALLEDVNDVVDAENRAAVTEILGNLSSASGRLDRTLEDFEALSDDLGAAAREVASFTDRLRALSDTAETTLTTATETLETAQGAIRRSESVIDQAGTALTTAERAFATADTLMQEDLSELVRNASSAAARIETSIETLEPAAAATLEAAARLADERLPALIARANETLDVVDREAVALSEEAQAVMALGAARLTEAEETLRLLDRTLQEAGSAMTSVEATSEAVSTLVTEDGQALIADARVAVSTIRTTVESQLPVLIEDVRGASQTANRVIESVGADVSGVAGRLEGLADEAGTTLAAATETFANANETLAAVTSAMETAEGTLGTAETTFASANRVIEEDVGAIVTDVRRAMETFTRTVDGASEDIEAISDEVLAAATSASNFVGTLEEVVVENRVQVDDFLRSGLPEFVRFIEEGRVLVENLKRLVARIERDPGRFLLGTQSSDFRR
ncbi:MlaD family protein [Ovoidimarina sediminis]|uniref:MlaD family protein n=1 Tax=Ovoidimarina sediminis TaxID=3079856 RepID=UPI002912A623|nr:MlaD family protein [Rhodophyticola sp. MJ-SS7]MDU8942195.1 MlaD family protein [Rhodophyticola sp. MJ-SS7]